MGQMMRMMSYDRAGNEAAAVTALNLIEKDLQWFRLDDGVMGGRSETIHSTENNGLNFQGNINTEGGGFCSIRAKLPNGFGEENLSGLKLNIRGDGKTYKVILSDGKGGSPFSGSPSWQADLPTKNGEEEEVVISFSDLKPSFGGRPKSRPEDMSKYTLNPSDIREIGLMLSLKLSDGSNNPKGTFGEGIFPFFLHVNHIQLTKEQNNEL
eukprot:CAMPEP_0194224102 /NCGR_PEP_ID=MMETSP0156-20130528/36672_1 /TAXON_ID=33649 /ORGANISM="Thalassionema nitzschioides, Strain L26-B" /LENGTH=209 /DNA_ID=CAMNT_0038955517 /DNA_START=47 /DNA_END=676 /DNA_ORIENTATION=+